MGDRDLLLFMTKLAIFSFKRAPKSIWTDKKTGSKSAFATPATAFRRTFARKFSIHFSRRSQRDREQGWDYRLVTTSLYKSTKARFVLKPRKENLRSLWCGRRGRRRSKGVERGAQTGKIFSSSFRKVATFTMRTPACDLRGKCLRFFVTRKSAPPATAVSRNLSSSGSLQTCSKPPIST